MKVTFRCLNCGYTVERDEPATVPEEAWTVCPRCERPAAEDADTHEGPSPDGTHRAA